MMSQSNNEMSASPARRPNERKSLDEVVTAFKSEGLGITQLRVALAQLKAEGREIVLSISQDGGLIITVPSMTWEMVDGKIKIHYQASITAQPVIVPPQPV